MRSNLNPKNTKQENKYEVKPQYEELSKQLIMQHSIINAMKCMRAIKDRIARPVYQLAIISVSRCINRGNHRSVIIGARTTHQSASHNVAFNQVINQSVNQARDAKQLKHNFKTEENTYPQAYSNIGTLGQDFTESFEQTGSSRFLKSTVPVSKLVSIGNETQEEFSVTNIIQNNGGTRRQSTKECYGEQ
ncbi:hypothetical protein F511_21105 [Dorcoceras hygrometricum]|uniref:Uncharacterized protein n=1 Tax=Dorcoceras hygrometricum TaxID=472368 RepID=A0A2Z7CQ81_9LAMI|nr:hypothetical protein F511_21105 [Dorcoceras hygrometricum]